MLPNLPLLQNALDQTQGTGRHNALSWRELVRERLAALNLPAVREDVSLFLERPQDAALLTRENLEGLLSNQTRDGMPLEHARFRERVDHLAVLIPLEPTHACRHASTAPKREFQSVP